VSDLLIADAAIVDGTGASARPGSILVSGDRIEAVLGRAIPRPKTFGASRPPAVS